MISSFARNAASKALLRRSGLKTGLRFKSAPALEQEAAGSASETSRSSVPIAQSLLAAVLGVGTVSIAAAVVEKTSQVPTYHPDREQFDQSNFVGRFSKMLLACDPRLLMYTEDQVRRMHALLQNPTSSTSDRELWQARRIVNAALHPDTGDVIPRPFRMSGYVPFNGPICVAMVASQSTAPLLFWSWVNQSQNALVNYYNRNACAPMTNETLAKSYAAAVGSALTVAFGLATFIQRRYSPAQAKALLQWVAFPSACIASSLNCYIVRRPEMTTGIPLLNDSGGDVAPGLTSQAAATAGVHATTLSRAILQAPVYFLPPVLLATVTPLKRFLTRFPTLTIPATTYLLLVSFGLGLPVTTAIFPQFSTLEASQVEERFQHLKDPSTGQPYKTFVYNKGL